MKKIVVASKNPVKINAVLQGFRRMFPDQEFEVVGIDIPSMVSAELFSDSETFQGALNRVEGAYQQMPDADFWAGIEAGVEDKEEGMESFSWIVVRSKDGRIGKSRTAVWIFPEKLRELVVGGKELGDAADMIFGSHNSKQKNGTIGILTGDIITRQDSYEVSVIKALIPFKNPDLYPLK